MAMIRRTAVRDKLFFDFRLRQIVHKGLIFRIYYGGRNIGKTTNIYRAKFQEAISLYKNGVKPDKIPQIAILMRTEKAWGRIKSEFLQNLKGEPFNMPIMIEGTSVYYVKHYEKTDKEGDTVYKYKRLFKLAQIIFLWSADNYKVGSLERYVGIVFDEVVPEFDMGYIPNEMKKFQTILSTFSRLRSDKWIVGICNNITDASIYFDFMGITPDNFPKEGEEMVDFEKGFVLEYCATSPYVADLQAKSTAGQVLKGTNYMAMAQGKKILTSENYMILSKPSGYYTPKYNAYIENVSYIVNQYSATAYWIEEGNNPYVKDYYLDKISAVRRGHPYDYVSPDWFANDFNSKMGKRRMWFQNYEIREIFLEWLRKNF